MGSSYRSRSISWCVEPGELRTPEATATAAEFPQKTPQPATLGSVPVLLLPPPETVADEKKELEWERGEGARRPPETSDRSDEDPEGTRLHLPRSSPVICRRHGDAPSPTRLGSSSPRLASSSPRLASSSPRLASSSPRLGSSSPRLDSSSPRLDSSSPAVSQDQHGRLTAGSEDDLGSKRCSCLQEEKKQRCVSASSNLNHFLVSLLHLPFSRQPAAGAGGGRGSSGGTHSPDASETSGSDGPGPADIFRSSCELEKENAHFVVVDLVLEVLEGVKWRLTSERAGRGPTAGLPQRRRACRRPEERGEEPTRRSQSSSVRSTDSGFEDFGGDASLTQTLTNAESLAQQLVTQFRRIWLPSREPQRGRLSLRSSLQELPGTGSVAASGGSLTEEIRLRTRMRGSLSWTPPSFQIIVTVQPPHRRSDVVALQSFLCAGCGTQVEPRYIRKLRYCEYLGRYFCACCHSGGEAVIPARVLTSWDFGRYPVSDFSKQLLDSVRQQPLFDLSCRWKSLCSRAKELHRFRELQEQLLGVRTLLRACRLSHSVLTACEQLPAHLLEQPQLFSMDDLLRVRRGQLEAQARGALQAAVDHVESCQLCLARGFICEFCRDRDILFPFQTDVCRRCPACKTCFHKHCFVGKTCPKCARIQSRSVKSVDA